MDRTIAERVIDAFGGVTRTADALGHKNATTVSGWKKSGRIPPWRKPDLLQAARYLGIDLPREYVEP